MDAYALWLLEESGEHLGVKAAFGLPAEGRLRRGEGLAGLVAQTGQALLVPEVSTEPGGPEPRRGACLAVPLRRPGRELLGVLTAHHPEPHGFTLADLDLGQAVANQVAAAL